MMISSVEPTRDPSAFRHSGGAATACLFAAVLLSAPVQAQETSEEILSEELPLVEQEVLIEYPASLEVPRRVEVRRALLGDDEGLQGAPQRERRRMTTEERNALHLELRRAVRSAYQDYPAH
ncbi:hypothetical protein E6C76_04385 [Pseudothauera nasutitermitis]|uniref:Uncharacterized protein n=1 Tax=Pseudothauera nasutitermitis TaxID=2565930 RepID=A0A4S4B0P6_9RHOO|nr:hypothetical protein [Pseudothauera nasutitermitis]THF66102.1 hypothetical protein E6C76_04385 [Pseudothauera nasutitermitis]